MTKKTKIIVICIAAAVALSAVTAAVISLSRRNKKPANETVDSSSVSQESSSAPDFAIKVTPSSDSSSAVQSEVKSRSEAVSEEISPEAFKKTVDAAACFYYMSFDSSSLSVRDCFDILESLTVEQSITGQNDFFPAERKDFSNLVTKDTAAAVFSELLGKSDVSDSSRLSSDGQSYEFMLAGGMGAPEATVLSAKSQSGGTFELTVKFYQQNAGGEVTVNQSARMTLEKVGGKYFDYRILSLAKLDG